MNQYQISEDEESSGISQEERDDECTIVTAYDLQDAAVYYASHCIDSSDRPSEGEPVVLWVREYVAHTFGEGNGALWTRVECRWSLSIEWAARS